MKIHKGDTVKILTGKDKGKSGKVIRADYKAQRLTIEGLNVYKKHVRPRRQGEKGEVVSVIRPINASNVILLCLNCKKGVRAAYRVEGGKKIRYCRKCQSII